MKLKQAEQALILVMAGSLAASEQQANALTIKNQASQIEDLQLMIMAKSGSKSFDDSNNNPDDNVLLQTGIEEKHRSAHRATMELKQKSDDLDVMAVDDLMRKYDEKEKVEKQNQDFVKVLKSDEKIQKFFLENYNPGADQADDEKFISFEFSKYSEQGWSEDGNPLDKQVLSKKTARKFANEVVQKWKGLDVDVQDHK